jgi:hypothetical protein
LRPKYVPDRKGLRDLSVMYEKQGLKVIWTNYDSRMEVYDPKTGRIKRVVMVKTQ